MKLAIKGMTCTSCERRIEEAVASLEGVLSVKANYAKSEIEFTLDDSGITIETVAEAVVKAGYGVKKDGKKEGGKEGFSAIQLIGIAVILLAVFLLLRWTGIFNKIPEIKSSMGYGLLFVIGLLTSFHCIAMCGGINLSQSIKKDSIEPLPAGNGSCSEITGTDNSGEKKPGVKKILPGVLYNTGRVISYTVIGGIVGAIGSAVSLSGKTQGIVVLVAGLFMVIMGLNMLNVFPFLRNLTPRLPKGITNALFGRNKNRGPFVVGLLNGLMPCGPLQSMQLYALGTGSFFAGALSMFLFSVGTVPLMLGFGTLGALLSKKFSFKILKISALVVVLLGGGMIARGFALNGLAIIPSFGKGRAPAGADSVNVARLESGEQLVQSDVFSSYYEPIIVQAGVPVRWTITVKAEDLNGCNNPITIPSLNIKKQLNAGENIITFTPDASGSVLLTCWMGMINSNILVVDDISTVSNNDLAVAAVAPDNPGGGCCSSGGGGTAQDEFIPALKAINTAAIMPAAISGGEQTVTINLTEEGFSPAVVVLQRGISAKWVFFGKTLTEENYRVIIPSYGAKIEFQENENAITLVPEEDFYFYSWQGDFTGFVKVVDNLAAMDVEAIRKDVEAVSQSLANLNELNKEDVPVTAEG
ncbi:MAG: heavy metal transporter [Spirochaetales bacterium]|nr:MAG: heavy metal transporter [Spirochaetales bacterium]